MLSVGLACGFGSSSSFSRAFRAHFGQSPREVRRR
ncbi:helix-turn-helix domain-containing protein [Litchfieldella rifensis]|uniref:Helix-turn-helix domain-containing protein n=1 Tax=Litchfieldella rifensis TaxID=762643 RepID=A0ABV7LQK8_9GAMM